MPQCCICITIGSIYKSGYVLFWVIKVLTTALHNSLYIRVTITVIKRVRISNKNAFVTICGNRSEYLVQRRQQISSCYQQPNLLYQC